MKRSHTALMFVLALGLCARPAVTQGAPREQGQSVQQGQQISSVTAIDEAHGRTYQLAELTTATIKVMPPTSQNGKKVSGKRRRVESQPNHRSKEDWARCLRNDACDVHDLFMDKWDRQFSGSPVNVFIGG